MSNAPHRKPVPQPRSVIVIGAGIVGMAAAWALVQRGHAVTLVDPSLLESPPCHGEGRDAVPAASFSAVPLESCSGSEAALGLLMADVFHRSRGRAWRLRQRSRELWLQWRQQLEDRGLPLPQRAGLLLLAEDQAQWQRQQALVAERRELGIPLELWPAERLAELQPQIPCGCLGALHSPRDGQLDAALALRQWRIDGQRHGLELVAASALHLEPQGGHWQVQLDSGGARRAEWIVLAAGLNLADLWPQAAAATPAPRLAAVLGQAVELAVHEEDPDPELWPGSLAWCGINLVPRPGRRLWLGATLEPGQRAEPEALARLRSLNGQAPAWLQRAGVIRHWQGLRVKPEGQPAPLLLQPAPGLVVVGGTYRNGVLLAPALAEQVVECLERP